MINTIVSCYSKKVTVNIRNHVSCPSVTPDNTASLLIAVEGLKMNRKPLTLSLQTFYKKKREK